MSNEENTKQTWQTPEIIDLDVAGITGAAKVSTTTEGGGYGNES